MILLKEDITILHLLLGGTHSRRIVLLRSRRSLWCGMGRSLRGLWRGESRVAETTQFEFMNPTSPESRFYTWYVERLAQVLKSYKKRDDFIKKVSGLLV